MSDHPSQEAPAIRKLWGPDKPEITRHFLRLDRDTRRLRFGGVVNDAFVRTYAEGAPGVDSVLFGAFSGGELRAIGELRGLYQSWPPSAEIALSVEPGWQGQGVGGALFSHLATAAQNRGVKTLHVLFLHENDRMRRIAEKHRSEFDLQGGQVEATLGPPWPTPQSIAYEMMGDARAYVRRMLTPTV